MNVPLYAFYPCVRMVISHTTPTIHFIHYCLAVIVDGSLLSSERHRYSLLRSFVCLISYDIQAKPANVIQPYKLLTVLLR